MINSYEDNPCAVHFPDHKLVSNPRNKHVQHFADMSFFFLHGELNI